MKRKYNYFYKITNNINGNFYYGVHKTDNLDDGYMGSGTRINYAFRKYGKQNFNKEIICFFDTYEEALNVESEIVNEELVLNPNCYNSTLGGGYGINDLFIKNEYHLKGAKEFLKKFNTDQQFRNLYIKKISEILKEKYKNGWKNGFLNKKHTDNTKYKMSVTHKKNNHQQGFKNSQYGSCWITNGKENKKINKNDLIPNGWKLGRKIK